ncbi:hypothetical protein MHYP_G00254730 [Metynnis hypsauchen]
MQILLDLSTHITVTWHSLRARLGKRFGERVGPIHIKEKLNQRACQHREKMGPLVTNIENMLAKPTFLKEALHWTEEIGHNLGREGCNQVHLVVLVDCSDSKLGVILARDSSQRRDSGGLIHSTRKAAPLNWLVNG